MANITIEELLSENQELRDLVVSLNTRLPRNSARKAAKCRRSRDNAEHLLEDAEECFHCPDSQVATYGPGARHAKRCKATFL